MYGCTIKAKCFNEILHQIELGGNMKQDKFIKKLQ